MADSFAVSVIRSRAVISLDSTLGALLVGNLLSMAYVRAIHHFFLVHSEYTFSLWGIICVQTYDYFLNFNDNLLQKSVVGSLLSFLIVTKLCNRLFCFGGFL